MRRSLLLGLPVWMACGVTACSSKDSGLGGSSGSTGNSSGASSTSGGKSNTSGGATNTSSGGSGTSGASATSGGNSSSGGSAGATSSNGGSAGASTGGSAGTTSSNGGSAGTSTGNGGSAGSKSGGGAGGTTAASGGTAGSNSAGNTSGGSATSSGASVLQHHNNLSRNGVYVDAKLTQAAAANLKVDTTFTGATVTGNVYAQPLYLAGTGGKPDEVIVATERNQVYAFNAASGARVWNQAVGTAVSNGLPCGNIATNGNTLGITGTPVIDGTSRTIYLDAMTSDTTVTAKHMVHALDADTGMEKTGGWPVDVNAKASANGGAFNSLVQNQRGALTIVGGKVFVPYGGHVGDCQGYHGWLVGISTSDPTQVNAWATRAIAGGVWGSSGPASDGTSLFFPTGNSKAMASDGPNTSPMTWGDGETVYKLGTNLAQPAMTATTDYFVPSNWAALDRADQDVGGTGVVLFSLAGSTPSNLLMALGKDGKAYLLNPANLGGMDAAPLTSLTVAGGAIINAAAAYTTANGTYVVFSNRNPSGCPAGQTGILSAIKITAGSPPKLSVAWCGGPTGGGSPAVSLSSAAGADPIVWVVGSDNKLHGVNGDTGQSVFGGGTTTLSAVQGIQTPIVANGRVFVASNSQVYAFTP